MLDFNLTKASLLIATVLSESPKNWVVVILVYLTSFEPIIKVPEEGNPTVEST